MNNKEIFQKLGGTFSDLLNGDISAKDANAVVKEADKSLKQLNLELNNFKRYIKIAKSRNQVLVSKQEGLVTFYGVPAIDKEFYFKAGDKAERIFNLNNIDYVIIHKDIDFE